MTTWDIRVDLKYCHPDYKPSVAGKTKKPIGETDKGKQIMEFLNGNKKLNQIQLIAKWKEVYPNERVLSSATITKYRKILKAS